MQAEYLFLEALCARPVKNSKKPWRAGDCSQRRDREVMSVFRVYPEQERLKKALVKSHGGDKYLSHSSDSRDSDTEVSHDLEKCDRRAGSIAGWPHSKRTSTFPSTSPRDRMTHDTA